MATALIVYQGTNGFGENKALTTVNIFETRTKADEAFEKVRKAADDWHKRANDREQFVTIQCVNGDTALDVSYIIALGIDDCLEENARKIMEEWNIGVNEIKNAGKSND